MKNERVFYWGNSVSSMQTEGGWNEGGKSPSVYDIKESTPTSSDWKFANDNYHFYEDDFNLIKDLGMNMYRFQISWSRVVKDGDGEFNEEGILYYSKLIDALLNRGIEPMICLYHFDMPLHLAEKYNGFVDKNVVDAFVRYGLEMVKRFSDKVKYWIVFNEQNLYHTPEAFKISGYLEGDKSIDDLYKILHNVMLSHSRVATAINKTSSKVGGMLAYSEVYPASCKPKDILLARQWDEFINYTLLDAYTKGVYSKEMMTFVKSNNIDMGVKDGELDEISHARNDFLSFSYYASTTINSDKVPQDTPPNYYLEYGKQDNPYIETTEWNWQIDSLGFRDVLNKMYQRYRLPVFPIENGIGVQEDWDGKTMIEDDYRIDYHSNHIRAMFDAINIDGVDVMGYLGWGLIDILSSQGDMRKRYGLVYVNRTNHDLKDMKRVPKKSYYWFKDMIANSEKTIS